MNRILGKTASGVGQLVMALWAAAILLPLYVVLTSTVKSNTDIYTNPLGFDFSTARWGNFWDALQGPAGGAPLGAYLANTLIASVVGLSIGLTAGILAAYGLARTGGPMIAALNRLMTVLMTVPILATMVPIFNLTGMLGMRDNPWGLGVVYAAFMIPGTALLMRPYFAAVPAEMIESARIDGASELRTFLQIVLPMAFPTILGVIVLNIMWVWGELTLAIVLLSSPEAKTLPVGLLAFKGQYFTDLGLQAAGLFLAALPMLVLYFAFSQKVTEGMSAGVLK